MNTRYNKYANPISKYSEEENEDACIAGLSDDKAFTYGFIADGAGGAGIFAKEWSNSLVNSLPPKPFNTDIDFNNWFINTSMLFEKTQSVLLALGDDYVKKKFYNEGSFSTLVAVWIDTENNNINYIGTGDSSIFIFEKTDTEYKLKCIYPINDQKSINDNPQLLNWRLGLRKDIKPQSINVSSGVVILASDSISRWIILNLIAITPDDISKELPYIYTSVQNDKHLSAIIDILINNKQSLSSFIDYLFEVNENIESFKAFCNHQLANTLLEPDDFSLISISI